jgi:hypothetical protein
VSTCLLRYLMYVIGFLCHATNILGKARINYPRNQGFNLGDKKNRR